MKKVLVIGGAGYIGSHFVKLVKEKYEVLAIDNFSQGRKNKIKGVKYKKVDILNKKSLLKVFSEFKPDVAVHYAAIANVEPSFTNPSYYYDNNIIGTLNILNAMAVSRCNKIIFSSTAALYEYPNKQEPISENHPLNPKSPYGYSKLVIERILKDYHRACGLRSISFRYFNASGLEKGLSCTHKESQVMPALVRAMNGEVFNLYGNEYPTFDGTAIRDYIHVNDLATAHEAALEKLDEDICEIYNLGTNKGFSVLQLITAASKISGKEISVQVLPRREGDPAYLVSDSSKAQRELNWKPKYVEIEDILRSNYES